MTPPSLPGNSEPVRLQIAFPALHWEAVQRALAILPDIDRTYGHSYHSDTHPAPIQKFLDAGIDRYFSFSPDEAGPRWPTSVYKPEKSLKKKTCNLVLSQLHFNKALLFAGYLSINKQILLETVLALETNSFLGEEAIPTVDAPDVSDWPRRALTENFVITPSLWAEIKDAGKQAGFNSTGAYIDHLILKRLPAVQKTPDKVLNPGPYELTLAQDLAQGLPVMPDNTLLKRHFLKLSEEASPRLAAWLGIIQALGNPRFTRNDLIVSVVAASLSA